MANFRGSNRGRQQTRPRRSSDWTAGIGSAIAQAAIVATGATLVNAAVAVLADGVTLVRTRGRLLMFLTNATAGADGLVGAFGIGIASTAAVTAGAASVPTPITEQGWDGWLYWQAVQLRAAAPLAGSASEDRDAVSTVSASQIVEIDSKAMRKVNDLETVYAALEVTELGTATLEWSVDTRLLFKLP